MVTEEYLIFIIAISCYLRCLVFGKNVNMQNTVYTQGKKQFIETVPEEAQTLDLLDKVL
jgi:hypothetical protein